MWDHNININSSELLCIKIKVSRINKHKNIFKIDNLHFLPNYIFTRLFEELKKPIRMIVGVLGLEAHYLCLYWA